jgi:SAM-dependent methyltransferase
MISSLQEAVVRQIFLIRVFRRWVVRIRIFWFVSIRRQLRSIGDSASATGTVLHNLRSLRSFNPRAEVLIRAVSIVEDVCDGHVLIVGCRNEDDLFVAKALNFKSVIGLDLISYSKYVVLGDMHQMSFADNSFDAVIVPYTLSYSASARLAISEFIRVCKDGGVIGIAVEYSDALSDLTAVGNLFDPADGYSYRSVNSILQLLGDDLGSVLVQYDGLKRRQHSAEALILNPSPVILVCTISKSKN